MDVKGELMLGAIAGAMAESVFEGRTWEGEGRNVPLLAPRAHLQTILY